MTDSNEAKTETAKSDNWKANKKVVHTIDLSKDSEKE